MKANFELALHNKDDKHKTKGADDDSEQKFGSGGTTHTIPRLRNIVEKYRETIIDSLTGILRAH